MNGPTATPPSGPPERAAAHGAGPGRSGPDTAATLLRAGLLPALVVVAVVTVAGLPAGTRGVAGALLGGGLAIAALAVGPLLFRVGRDLNPVALFAVAVAGYLGVVGVLAVVYLLLGDASWFSGRHAGAGVIGACLAWVVGQARATARLRILTFGDRVPPD